MFVFVFYTALVLKLAGHHSVCTLPHKWSLGIRTVSLDSPPHEPSTKRYVHRLAAKYQRSVDQAQKMLDTMTQAISVVGGHADSSKVIAVNTFNTHRLIQCAGDTDRAGTIRDAQHQLTDAFMRRYLGEGLNLGKDKEMLNVVTALKLSRSDATEVLASQRYADVVRSDEQAAQEQGIQGVPFFVIGGYGLSGAQPSEALVDAIRQVQLDQNKGA